MHLILKRPFIFTCCSPPFYIPRVGLPTEQASVKAARQDQKAHLSPGSPETSQVKLALEKRVRLGVGAWGRTSESQMRYWLGHILEERVSQSCLCRNPLVGVVV